MNNRMKLPAKSEFRPVLRLAYPIFVETMLRLLLGNIDQVMLSKSTTTAVAAVGNANQVINILILVLDVVCMATTIIVAQHIGAGKLEKLPSLYTLSVAINSFTSIVCSVILIFLQKPIFTLMKLPPELYPEASSYFTIVAAGFFLQGIFMSFSAILRSNAMMKEIMFISFAINIVNVVANLFLINGYGGFPELGATGAAIATNLSRLIGAIMIVAVYCKRIAIPLRISNLRPFPRKQMGQLFKVGLPAAGDNISYNMMQMVLLAMINGYGLTSVSARMYVSMIMVFVYMYASSIAQATQIHIGYAIGRGEYALAKSVVKSSLFTSLAVSFLLSILLYLGSDWVFFIFTSDVALLELIKQVMLVEIFLELGRAVNLVMIRALLAAGDTAFPVTCAIFSMWMVAVPIAYMLGTVCGFGMVGVWIGLAADEWCRATAFIIRWKCGRWQSKGLVDEKDE